MEKIGKKIASLGVLLFCWLSLAMADNTITATVSPNPASVDESVLLRIEISVDGGNRVGRPTFDGPGFDVVGQSSSLQTTTVVDNGKYSLVSKHVYSFVLYPKDSGNKTISKIQAQVGSDALKADDIIVQVRPGSGKGRNSAPQSDDQQDDDDQDQGLAPQSSESAGQVPKELNSDFTVFLNLDKKSAYVGEPVVAEYWIYDHSNLQHMDIKKWPAFNGFWKEDLEVVVTPTFEAVYAGNKRVRRALLGRFALYGIKPGRTNIEKLVVDGTYFTRLRPDNDDDGFFFPFFGQGQVRKGSHASQDATIEILPLPEAGRLANFGGAVGNFNVSIKSDKQTLDVNTPLNLQVVFDGVGNFPAIEEPKLPLPADLELFESNVVFKDSVAHGLRRPVANKKTFNFVIIPRKPGAYTINPVQFSFFDPKKKAYQTLSTESVKIQVTGSVTADEHAKPTLTAQAPRDLSPAKSSAEFYQKSFSGSLVWALSALALLAALSLLVFTLVKGKWLSKLQSKRTSGLNANKIIRQLKAAQAQESFNALVEESLYQAISVLIGKPAIGALRDELEIEWRERKFPAELFHSYYKLLDRVAALRYSRSTTIMGAKEQLLKDLEAFLKALEKLQR